jgi:hypothetical protein
LFTPEDDVIRKAAPESLESVVAIRVAERNRQTRDLLTYVSHREHTMRLLTAAAVSLQNASEKSVSVLGAGNCLDLDLKKLSTQFHKINLLDLDPTAVAHGFGSQLPENHSETASARDAVNAIAPVDLATPLANLTREDFADAARVDQICSALAAPFESVLVSPADVVASTCLLSQMIDGLSQLTSQNTPSFVPLLQGLRQGHFRRMLQLLKPRGQGIFISDLVSSDSTPVLKEVSDNQLPQLLAQCLSSGNFFSGLNPGIVLQELQSCSGISDQCSDVQIHPPWRWHMGPRVYAVYAVTFRKL